MKNLFYLFLTASPLCFGQTLTDTLHFYPLISNPVEISMSYGNSKIQFYDSGKIEIEGDTLSAIRELHKYIKDRQEDEIDLLRLADAAKDYYNVSPGYLQQSYQAGKLEAYFLKIGYTTSRKKSAKKKK